MDGTLPKESGQPALSPFDVEPTSETVRTSDAPVSSRLRSARCGSIASETNLLDHMFTHAAEGGTYPSNSVLLASPRHFHEAPASTAARNASSNYSYCHRPEARYPVMTNGNGGGPIIIQAPSGPRMLNGQDDRQSRTDDQQQSTVLTLASDGAEMSWVLSVLGPKCLDTFSDGVWPVRTVSTVLPAWFIWTGIAVGVRTLDLPSLSLSNFSPRPAKLKAAAPSTEACDSWSITAFMSLADILLHF